MKVALLVPGGVDRSGTHRVVPCLLALIERLAGHGDDVHIFSLRHEPEPGRWTLLGVPVHNAGRRPRSARSLWAMLREHRRARFNVVHAICYVNRTAVVGAAASWIMRVPLVLTLVDGEVACHPDIAFGGQLTRKSRWGLRAAAQRAAAITTQSDFMRDLAARAHVSARTVILGVDLRHWPVLAPRSRVAGVPLRLLHVGRFTAVKDQATLLEAMARLRGAGHRFELEIVGDGVLSATLEQAVRRLELEDVVRFSPAVAQAELRPLFERADVVVISSIHESGPMVALEAAVAGVPTVGTAVGYVADWAPRAALAVPVGDAGALAAAIAELALDESKRLDLAAAAQGIAARFDADHTAQVMRQIYREAATFSVARIIG